MAVATAVAGTLLLAAPVGAQIAPQPSDPSDADTYRECRAAVVERGGDELDAARECVPEPRDLVVCIGTGRVTRAEVVRCVEVQIDDAYEASSTTTTSTADRSTTTTTSDDATTATTDAGAAVERVVEEVDEDEDAGDGGDGFGLPVVLVAAVAGLVLGGAIGLARGRRSSMGGGGQGPTVAAVPTPGPVFGPGDGPEPIGPPPSSADRDALVRALIETADQVSSEAVRTTIVQRLGAVGVEPVVVAVGERFDPTTHRGVDAAAAPSPEQNDTVASLERPGWVDRGRVLRPPEVVVNRWEEDPS